MVFAMKPPFRADQVGSLLRPAALAAARVQFKQGALSATKVGASPTTGFAMSASNRPTRDAAN